MAPSPASAHPFGDPQTLELTADGRDVVAEWRVGGDDDLVLLGISLGLLPKDRILLDGAVVPEPADAETMAAAPEFEAYLTERITVTAQSQQCPGNATDASTLTDGAVTLTFSCPTALDDVEVTSRMLTDLHPAYRLLATGPQGQKATYNRGDPRHLWAFDQEPSPAAAANDLGRSAALQIAAVLGALAVLVLVASLGRRRWQRTREVRA